MVNQQEFIEVRPFTGEEIYLPIWEEESIPLEVQLGCGWHRCKFCDFANDPRHVFSLPEVAAKAQMLAQYFNDRPRVFLLGENALTLPMDYLRVVMEIIGWYSHVTPLTPKQSSITWGVTREPSPHMPIVLSRGNFQVLQRKVGLPRVATPRVGLIYLPEARHACIS